MSASDPGASAVAEAAADQAPEIGVLGFLARDREVSVSGLRDGIGFIPGLCVLNHEIASIFKGHHACWVDGLGAIQGSLQASDLGFEGSRISAVMTPLDKEGKCFSARSRSDGAEIAQGGCIIETDLGFVDVTLKEKFNIIAQTFKKVKSTL